MNNISRTTLGNLVEFQRGYDLPKSQFVEGNVPVISSNGILGFHNIAKVKAPGITIGRSGTVGLPHFINEDFFPHNTALFIKDFKGNNVKYIFYLIKTLGLNDYKSGSGVPTMNRNHLHPIEISAYLNISTQSQIAKVLSDLDAKIELNNKINAELEAMAKLIYDYWFVQFEFPFDFAQGKPKENVTLSGVEGYKSSGGKMVFNEELKREIPEGWEVKKLGKVLRTELGGTPSTKNEEFWGGEFPWLNSGEIANFPIIDSELKITELGIKNSATTLMPKGTCVLSITRHLRPSILGVDSCANQSVVGIFESEKLKNSFIYPHLVNDIPRLMTLRSGAQQPHINKGTVDDSKIIEPTDNVLDKYYSVVDSYYHKILNNTFQIKLLAELRDWLLPMLMNGQVKVGGVSEELGMVAEGKVEYEKTKKYVQKETQSKTAR